MVAALPAVVAAVSVVESTEAARMAHEADVVLEGCIAGNRCKRPEAIRIAPCIFGPSPLVHENTTSRSAGPAHSGLAAAATEQPAARMAVVAVTAACNQRQCRSLRTPPFRKSILSTSLRTSTKRAPAAVAAASSSAPEPCTLCTRPAHRYRCCTRPHSPQSPPSRPCWRQGRATLGDARRATRGRGVVFALASRRPSFMAEPEGAYVAELDGPDVVEAPTAAAPAAASGTTQPRLYLCRSNPAPDACRPETLKGEVDKGHEQWMANEKRRQEIEHARMLKAIKEAVRRCTRELGTSCWPPCIRCHVLRLWIDPNAWRALQAPPIPQDPERFRKQMAYMEEFDQQAKDWRQKRFMPDPILAAALERVNQLERENPTPFRAFREK